MRRAIRWICAVMVSVATLVTVTPRARSRAIDTDIELGGFLAVLDMAPLSDGRLPGVVANGVADSAMAPGARSTSSTTTGR